MAEHVAQDSHRDGPAAATAAPHASLASAPAVASLSDTADILNARPQVVALKALGAQLSDRGTPLPVQRAAGPPAANRTGLPDQLKHGVEALSGRATGITGVTAMVMVDIAALPSESVTW